MIKQHPGIAPGRNLQLVVRQDELVIDFLDRRTPSEVGVRFDHAGHQCAALPVNHEVGSAIGELARVGRNAGDAITIDQHRAIGRDQLFAVKNADVADQCPHGASPQ